MANPMKGEARLGDYTLVFNFGTFVALETRFSEIEGRKVATKELSIMLLSGLSFNDTIEFLIAGLQQRHPDKANREAVIEMVNAKGMEVTSAAMSAAISSFFPEEKDENPQKAAAD